MLRLSCGEYEKLELNSIRKSLEVTITSLEDCIKSLKHQRYLYLESLHDVLMEEKMVHTKKKCSKGGKKGKK